MPAVYKGVGMTKLDKMIKVASSNLAQKILFPVVAAGATLGVTHGIMPAIKRRNLEKQKAAAWAEIKKRAPELAKGQGVKEQFEAMHDLTPKVMGHPTFAIPVLKQSADYGTDGIPLQLLQMASGIESGSAGVSPKSHATGQLPIAVAQLAGRMV